ncbi:hypothetical protein ARMGADRAFT_1166034 [Armillaria gallica]|uniref:Uncharacterized protein n=1 Tax=Armillaria gallica TaxID=47427 RepID=A0A2H3DWI9_ARMGA|nr:hypothetical protein ARMGADRAFT_1166034 [Armillaria gallica]
MLLVGICTADAIVIFSYPFRRSFLGPYPVIYLSIFDSVVIKMGAGPTEAAARDGGGGAMSSTAHGWCYCAPALRRPVTLTGARISPTLSSSSSSPCSFFARAFLDFTTSMGNTVKPQRLPIPFIQASVEEYKKRKIGFPAAPLRAIDELGISF